MISAFDKLVEGTKFEAQLAMGWISQSRSGAKVIDRFPMPKLPSSK